MKKKSKKKRQSAAEELTSEERREEIVALQLIYGEDLVARDDGSGFCVHVVPHPGEAFANHISMDLQISYSWRYPDEALQLRLINAQGLSAGDVKAVATHLQAAAAEHAEAGELCCFQLIQEAQELLQDLNAPAKKTSEEALRASAPETPTSVAAVGGGQGTPQPWVFEGFDWADGGLFSDTDAAWSSVAAATVPTVQVAVPPRPPRPPPKGAVSAAAPATADMAAPLEPPMGASGAPAAAEGSAEPSSSITLQQQSHSFSTRVLSFSKAAQGLVPKALRRFLDSSKFPGADGSGADGASDTAGSEASFAAGVPEDESERQQLRQELLLGHLLTLATGEAPTVPAHTLPAVASMLQRRGLLPRWLGWALTQQPALFDRAFKRLFAEELAAAAGAGGEGAADPTASWAVNRFWQRRPATPGLPHVLHSASQGGRSNAALQQTLPASRYESDFSEVRQLGRGGYGVVVLAVNRFDHREYAVKRITLSQQSPAAYARIMREVTTLSRLHHPNVVRYFQAWVEDAFGGGGGSEEGTEDSELGAWASGTEGLTTDMDSRSTTPPPPMLRSGPTQRSARALSAVEETSREGRPSSLLDSNPTDAASDTPTVSGGGILGVAAASFLLEQRAGGSDSDSGGMWQPPRQRAGSSSSGGGSTVTETDATGTETSNSITFEHSRPAPATVPGLTRQRTPKFSRFLFIQMEYCHRTLRDVLDAGSLSEEARWKCLRQLLSGLAHIHAQGIIHRDLKPANLFEDARGDLKLGDFGLAKFTSAPGTEVLAGAPPGVPGTPAAKPPPAGLAAAASGASLSDTTGLVGTSYYISPEIQQGWASYDEKVDIWAVGVIAFEIWHPFSTAMERAMLLRDLRERGTMPAAFEDRQPQVARLVRWLMAPKPADRPTAREVLRSELLPPTVADEHLTDLLRSLPDNPAAHDRVMDALFTLPSASEATASAAAAGEAPGAPCPAGRHLECRERVLDAVRSAFSRHGAQPLCSLEVGSAAADDAKGTVQLLSRSGAPLALRHELRQPFAAWVARQVACGAGVALLEGLRRYEVAAVFRRAAGQELPRCHLQADFDILTPVGRAAGAGEPPVAEAEAVCAVADLLGALPECSGRWEVRLGHRSLFEAALAHAGVAKDLRSAAMQLLRTAAVASPLHPQARQQRWPAIRAGLEGLGLGQEVVARCKQLVLQAAGEAQASLHRLSAMLPPSSCSTEVQAVLPLLAVWGIPPAGTVVDPLVPPQADYFSGLLFEVHMVDATGASSVVAVGGRYDALLKGCWARQSATAGIAGPLAAAPLGGVGATVSVERLVQVLAAGAGRQAPHAAGGLRRLSASDVLVCSRGSGGKAASVGGRLTERTSGRLMERVRLLRLLWDAGIAAEMVPTAAPSLTDQYAYANAAGIPWLVILNADEVAFTEQVRVKHLNSKVEEDVPVADVARYLLAVLQPHAGQVPPALRSDDADSEPDGEGFHVREKDRRRGGKR